MLTPFSVILRIAEAFDSHQRSCFGISHDIVDLAYGPIVRVRPTSVAELRAGSPRWPHRGTLAAATDECLGGSEVQPA